MTKGRALLIGMLHKYRGGGYSQTQLEVQKIMYFMKEAGVDLQNLSFVKHQYGPYSEGVRHALGKLEGSYINGFGDGTQRSEIRVKNDAVKAAIEFLRNDDEALAHLRRVSELIEGFETPFGMELLSTVHWVTRHEGARSKPEAIQLIKSWNERKAKVMSEDQVRVAYDHLVELNWIET